MRIFDRWGNMIYYIGKTMDPETCKAWVRRVNDGGGSGAREDVYVWVVKLKDIFGKSHKYIGRDLSKIRTMKKYYENKVILL